MGFLSWDAYAERFISKSLRPFFGSAVSQKRISQEFFKKIASEYSSSGARHLSSLEGSDYEISTEKFSNARVIFVSGGDEEFEDTTRFVGTDRIVWFVQNLTAPTREGIRPLPIGVEGIQWVRAGMPWNFINAKPFRDRFDKVLVGPFRDTHPVRAELVEILDSPSIVTLVKWFSAFRYSLVASNYKYVACPRGNGVDTHRFWETLYRGSIPVVAADQWAKNLRSEGVPFVEVESWGELQNVPADNQHVDWAAQIRDCKYLDTDYWRQICSGQRAH